MNNQHKQILIWVAIFTVMIISFNFLQGNGLGGSNEKLAFSDFLSRTDDGQINSVKINGRNIEGTFRNGGEFSTYAADYPGLIDRLNSNNVHIEVVPPDTKMGFLFSIFVSWFPMLLLIGVWIFFMRQMQGGGKGMGFGKSKAKLVSDKGTRVTFKDVAGINEAKEELVEIVDFLRDPLKFQKLGGQIPKGCLLIGSPGSGKTLLAKAIAGEANVPFFSISGSDFVEMFVGIGASRVRDMFEQGKRNAPCIIFIDEIDAVGRHRGAGLGGGNDEREQTLNQMLVEMDGFQPNEGVVIVAATNRPDVLDRALLRPGRFDRQITVSNPDVDGREQILKVHMKKIKHSEKIDVRVIARGTPGFSGAELRNLVNEAALLAARSSKKLVDMEDFDNAKDKVLMGVERKSHIMSEEDKKLTAYHEAGHALVGLYCKESDPIHKATIIPRGQALGMVQTLPEKDGLTGSLIQIQAKIAVAMGGRIAEELIFGKSNITNGAAQDIKVATYFAKSMVQKWGLSEALGPVYYAKEQDPYMGNDGSNDISEKTAELIDKEISRLLNEGMVTARTILSENSKEHHDLTNALLEHETLTGKQIKHLLLGNDINDESEPDFPKKYYNVTSVNGKVGSVIPVKNPKKQVKTGESKTNVKKDVSKKDVDKKSKNSSDKNKKNDLNK